MVDNETSRSGPLRTLRSALDSLMPATSSRQFWTEAALWMGVSFVVALVMNAFDLQNALLRGALGAGLPFGAVYAKRYVGWRRKARGRSEKISHSENSN